MKTDSAKFDKPFTIEPYNSNNAWGFGGTCGHKYIFSPELYLIIGSAGTRHRGVFPHMTLTYDGVYGLVDLSGHSKENIETINKWVNAIMDKTVIISEEGTITTYKLP